jgi:hypothetical protein
MDYRLPSITIILQLKSLIYKALYVDENIAVASFFTGDPKKSEVVLFDKMV